MKYDAIIIGGGPSGMMAAISAAKNSNKVLLIEKNNTPGKKLLLTGGGRCNITNNKSIEHIIDNIIGNGKFLYSAFSNFNNQDIINFFNKKNVELKEEDSGRIFPKTNSSKTILNALIDEMNLLNVEIINDTKVIDIIANEKHIDAVIIDNNEKIFGNNFIIATGGLSFPLTGSTGDGYKFARKLNHNITELLPSEVPLISNDDFIKNQKLKGLSLQNVNLTVLNKKNKPIITHNGDMIFTHFGISGPAAIRCSSFIVKQKRENVLIKLDSLANYSQDQLFKEIINYKKSDPKKSLKNIIKNYVPERYANFICDNYAYLPITDINNNIILKLVNDLKGLIININGTLPIDKAFVTMGGIKINEIDPKTMRSKLIDNLYFAGEVMDINAYTGGYNITAALVSGYTAGMLK